MKMYIYVHENVRENVTLLYNQLYPLYPKTYCIVSEVNLILILNLFFNILHFNF